MAEALSGGTGALAATWLRMRHTWLRHLGVVGGLCLGIAFLLTVLAGGDFGTKLVYSSCIGLICTLIVDATRLLVAWGSDRARRSRGLPYAHDRRAWFGAIPGALLAMVIGPSIGLTLADAITGKQSLSLLQFDASSTRLTLALSVLGTAVAVVVISTMERLSAARALAEAAQRQAAEHQLRLLQSQLEPHMLFNTLANLRVLIGLDAPRAQAMLDRLIAYLRATLQASRVAAHPLATEFERVDDYLALMAVRMGARLQVNLDLPAALRELPVPPLLLQPLVENAIRHGLEPHVQGGRITVSARREGEALVLSVHDSGAGLPATPTPAAGGGFGLAQVRERLATLHGDQAALSLATASDGGTLASIRLPLPASAAAKPARSA